MSSRQRRIGWRLDITHRPQNGLLLVLLFFLPEEDGCRPMIWRHYEEVASLARQQCLGTAVGKYRDSSR
jgi:hypothetical protein